MIADNRKFKKKILIPAQSALSGNTPRIRLLVFVVQRLEPLISFDFAELGRVRESEKGWSKFHQPLGIDDSHFTHVLLCGLNQFVVDDPLGLPVKDRATRVNVDHLAVHQRPITFLRILLGRVSEKTRTDRFLHPSRILASGYHVQLVPETFRRTNVRFLRIILI